ncbi:MAG: response regulator [Candidatus Aceula meridiana]|nr:response regulator [Candidatus Aceula meridiana]
MATILIVDDEPDILKVLEKDVLEGGYEVVTAKTAKESIDKAKEVAPDLILMDVLLPDMGGADAIKVLRNYPEFKTTPVLFITAMVKPEEERHGSLKINIDEDWYETIAKPFERDELLGKIKELLKK